MSLPLVPVSGLATTLAFAASLQAQTTRTVPGQFPTISAALAAAQSGDRILVGPGIYNEAGLDFTGRQIVLRSTDGAAATVIDAAGMSGMPILSVTSGEPAGTVVRGFTLTNASWSGGGGIRVGNASGPFGTSNLIVRDCIFEANQSPSGSGAGISVEPNADVQVTSCLFSNGVSQSGSGAGIDVSGGNSFFGAPSTAVIEGCTFVGNSAPSGGGCAIDIEDEATVVVRSCLFHDNLDGTVLRASGFPFGAPTDVPLVDIVNCTFTDNTNVPIAIDDGAVVNVLNTIVWGNAPTTAISGGGFFLQSSLDLRFSDIEGGAPATIPGQFVVVAADNVDVDPLFVDPASDDFRIQPGSPLVDAADPNRVVAGRDFLRGPRLVNGDFVFPPLNDIGAHELPVLLLETSDPAPPTGSPFTLTATPTRPGSVLAAATLFASVFESDVVFPAIGQLLLDPAFLLAGDFAAGTTTAVNPGLLGLTLKFQVAGFVVDVNSGDQTLTLTNTVDVRLP